MHTHIEMYPLYIGGGGGGGGGGGDMGGLPHFYIREYGSTQPHRLIQNESFTFSAMAQT